jgi:hypothetical protein
MKSTAFDVLIGLRLAIVRRAADMLVVHFGDIHRLPRNHGAVVSFAPHLKTNQLHDRRSGGGRRPKAPKLTIC